MNRNSSVERCTRDTETPDLKQVRLRTPAISERFVSLLVRCAFAVSLLCPVAHPNGALAQPSPLEARVVWVRGDRVYLASLDSAAVEPGTILTFKDRRNAVAVGEVAGVYEGELIAARLTSGSLRAVKRLDRIQVMAERPPLRAAPILRLGYPTSKRSNLLFTCSRTTLRAPAAERYQVDIVTDRSYRLVRSSEGSAQALWPDTLVLRLFDDAADEEIALERGELDAAIFWPGEASAHIREQTRWPGTPSGTLARGALLAISLGVGTPPSLPAAPGDSDRLREAERHSIARLNEELFRGDLAPCGGPGERAQPVDSSATRPWVRFEVAPSLPGKRELESNLNQSPDRILSLDLITADFPRVRMSYLDAPVHSMDSLALAVAAFVRTGAFTPALRARANNLEAEIRREWASSRTPDADRLRDVLADSLQVTCLFALRSPVISAPKLRSYLDALGADNLVNLLVCEQAWRKP